MARKNHGLGSFVVSDHEVGEGISEDEDSAVSIITSSGFVVSLLLLLLFVDVTISKPSPLLLLSLLLLLLLMFLFKFFWKNQSVIFSSSSIM